MEYDKSKKHSRWIAFRFDNQTKQQNVSRSDEPFDADPAIGSQYQRCLLYTSLSGSNRNYILRGMYTYSTGLMNNGWAFTGSLGYRWRCV